MATASSKQTKLTKAQQALYTRIQNGEKVSRSFSGKWHGEDRKTIPQSVIDGLKSAGVIKVDKQEVAMRIYYVATVTS